MSKEKPIWQKNRVELFRDYSSSEAGLTDEEAKKRLEQYGPNELQEGKRKSVLRIFLEQFADFTVIILIIAAIISGVTGSLESTIVIVVVIDPGHGADCPRLGVTGQSAADVRSNSKSAPGWTGAPDSGPRGHRG